VFADRATIFVQGGGGGDGCIAFRREKFVPKGGPSGGDGGHGGDVVLVADPDLRDLSRFRYASHFKGERGQHGQGATRAGRRGAALELHVPVGTEVRERDGERLLADLAHPGARVTVAHGGRGGRGNRTYATATHRTPWTAQVGEPGDERWLELRLKLLADAALLGFPNAGKSSLLRRLSAARPKVADYPFTTLEPVLGVVEDDEGRQLVVADVPGLLEGASEGVGLGDEFLAHLERARLLVHLVEPPPDADDPGAEAMRRRAAIDRELALHGGGLAERPQLVVLSKVDLVPPPDRDRLRRAAGADLAVSAATGEGLDELRAALFRAAGERPAEPAPAAAEPELADYLVYRPAPARREYRILRDAGVLRIAGRSLEREAQALDPESERDVARLAARLRALGVEESLRAAGAAAGDEVAIGPHRFVFQPAGPPENDWEADEE
jgi:GTP-binding protein